MPNTGCQARHPIKKKYTMRMIANIAGVSALLLLSACSSAPPKLSQEALTAKRLSTLNVYDDNRVGLKSYRAYESHNSSWVWSTDKDRVLGLMIDDNIFNVKDVQSISSKPLASRNGSMNELTAERRPERRHRAAHCGGQ